MAWREEELVPLSALQHVVFCPRQCALIHVEQTFDENIYTLRGQRAHERVERAEGESVGEGRVEYALPLWNDRLGLVGKADAVWFDGRGRPFPVEHKVGRRKARLADEVQLCGQALCLEEMLGVAVPRGALYYHGSRARQGVEFSDALRERTEQAVGEVRALFASAFLPPPVADKRCTRCSLLDACMPHAIARQRGAAG